MKKTFLTFMALSAFGLPVWALDQNEAGVYEISTPQDLVDFSKLVNTGAITAEAALLNDLDMKGVELQPIGGNSASAAFKGKFNGNYFTISNLVMNYPDKDYVALFGCANELAEISNLTLDKTCAFTGNNFVAAVAAADPADGGNFWFVRNINVYASVKGNNCVAQILGASQGTGNATQIDNCFLAGNVSLNEGVTQDDDHRKGALVSWGHFIVANGVLNLSEERFADHINAWPPSNFDNSYSMYKDEQQAAVVDESWISTGELCYRLNRNNKEGGVWKQNIDTEGAEKDGLPTLAPNHADVFRNGTYACNGADIEDSVYSFSNIQNFSQAPHQFDADENGIQICGLCKDINIELEPSDRNSYLVKTGEDLEYVAKLVNLGYRQNINIDFPNDIDMVGIKHTPIGTFDHPYTGACGDMREKSAPIVIKNLVVDNPDDDYQGLFGCIISPAHIRGIILDSSCSITGRNYVGGIFGWGNFGYMFISNLGNEADITATGIGAGGIYGFLEDGGGMEIKHVYNTGNISADSIAGGIAGKGHLIQIYDGCCYNAGKVTVNKPWLDENGNEYNRFFGRVAIATLEENSCFNLGETFKYGDKTILGFKEGEIASGALCYKVNKNLPAQKTDKNADLDDATMGMSYYRQNLPDNEKGFEPDPYPTLLQNDHLFVCSTGGLRASYYNIYGSESGIHTVIPDREIENHTIFTLEGIKVDRPTSTGLYIIDGKKVFVKK